MNIELIINFSSTAMQDKIKNSMSAALDFLFIWKILLKTLLVKTETIAFDNMYKRKKKKPHHIYLIIQPSEKDTSRIVHH